MSKITQEKKEARLKGKQAKIAKTKAKAATEETATEKPKTKCKNYGCCCTCSSFPKKIHGCVQPCSKLGKYVPRKATHPECYKCKY